MHKICAKVGKWTAAVSGEIQNMLTLLSFAKKSISSPKPSAQGSSPCTPAKDAPPLAAKIIDNRE